MGNLYSEARDPVVFFALRTNINRLWHTVKTAGTPVPATAVLLAKLDETVRVAVTRPRCRAARNRRPRRRYVLVVEGIEVTDHSRYVKARTTAQKVYVKVRTSARKGYVNQCADGAAAAESARGVWRSCRSSVAARGPARQQEEEGFVGQDGGEVRLGITGLCRCTS
ncbi:hypothetical protein EJB05_39765, partial [Eragrostis curvula]